MPGWLLVVLQIVFVVMSAIIWLDYRRRGSPTLLVGVAGYLGSAAISSFTESGWPLLIGFLAMIALKRLGYDLG